MVGERHPAEEIDAKLRQVELPVPQAKSAPDAVRLIGIAETAYCR